MIAGYRGLIDKDTPDNRMTRTGYDGKVSVACESPSNTD